MIKIADSIDEIKRCVVVLLQLRTALTQKTCFDQIIRQQKAGYKLAYVEKENEIVSVAGFRILECLAYGKFMYIDDLITDSKNRSKGYGDMLFNFLTEYAAKEVCMELHLDSGVQRFDAHRFYLKKRMNITAHHFGMKLSKK